MKKIIGAGVKIFQIVLPGVLINNFGFSSVDIQNVVKQIVPKQINNNKLIGVVIGQKPYYATINNNKLTFEQNRKFKIYIEKQFMSAGCIGTITLHDDGRDLSETHNNNLSSSKFK